MKAEFFALPDQWLAAAVSGIYQGALVALVVWAGLRLFRRTNAATRHAVWFMTLLLVLAIFSVHIVARSSRPAPRPADPTETANLPSRTWMASANPSPADTGSSELHDPMNPSTTENLASVEPPENGPELVAALAPRKTELGIGQVSPSPSQSTSLLDLFLSAFSLSDPYIRAALFAHPDAPDQGWWERIRQELSQPFQWEIAALPRYFSLVIIAAWLLLMAVKIQRLVARLRLIGQWKDLGTPPSREMQQLFFRLRRRLGVSRKVELRLSSHHSSAMLLGFLHPVILLPDSTTLAEAEPVLCHELAHLARGDDWANLLQQFLAAIFFAHPVGWWISRRLLLEREVACDDYVLQQGTSPRAYALLLANLAGRWRRPVMSLAPGASTHKSQLHERIDMILNKHRNTSPRLTLKNLACIASVAAVLSVALVCSAPRLVLASNSSELPPADIVAAAELPPVAGYLAQAAAPADPLAVPSAGVIAPAVPIPPVPPAEVPSPWRVPPAKGGTGSMEERLERVERMLQALLEQQSGKPPGISYRPKGPEELAWKAHAPLDAKAVQQITERAKIEAARATEEARRQARDAERIARKQAERSVAAGNKQVLERKLEALEEQLERLAAEKENLQEELNRLEKGRHHDGPPGKVEEKEGETESDLKGKPRDEGHDPC